MDIPHRYLQGAVCHQSCSAITAHAICRAIVKWNVFYISSNGLSLLINWVYVVCIFQDPSRGRTFQKLPLTAPPRSTDTVKWYRCGGGGLLNGISVSMQTGNIIVHVHKIWIGDLSDNDSDFLSWYRIPQLSEFALLPDLETLVVSGAGAEWRQPAGNLRPCIFLLQALEKCWLWKNKGKSLSCSLSYMVPLTPI